MEGSGDDAETCTRGACTCPETSATPPGFGPCLTDIKHAGYDRSPVSDHNKPLSAVNLWSRRSRGTRPCRWSHSGRGRGSWCRCRRCCSGCGGRSRWRGSSRRSWRCSSGSRWRCGGRWRRGGGGSGRRRWCAPPAHCGENIDAPPTIHVIWWTRSAALSRSDVDS